MGELAEDFALMRDVARQERESKTPQRKDYAIKELLMVGIVPQDNGDNLTFTYKGSKITFWPYTGWASGKTIKDGRGILTLVKQLKDNNETN